MNFIGLALISARCILLALGNECAQMVRRLDTCTDSKAPRSAVSLLQRLTSDVADSQHLRRFSSKGSSSSLWSTPAPTPPLGGGRRYLGGEQKAGNLDASIAEASGLACSRQQHSVCFTHNDSGGYPRIFAIRDNGELLATIEIKGTINNEAYDWEDIAIQGNHIYIGEIGDNREKNPTKTIYRIAEPTIAGAGDIITAHAEKMTFDLPSGNRRDSESLFVDPQGTVYLITKTPFLIFSPWGWLKSFNKDHGKQIWQFQWGSASAQHVGELHPFIKGERTTAADMSADGSLIAVRTYQTIYLWETKGKSVTATLESEPSSTISLTEAQGEAIAFDANGSSLFTVSEKSSQPVWKIPIKHGAKTW